MTAVVPPRWLWPRVTHENGRYVDLTPAQQFTDFLRAGIPLNLIVVAIMTAVTVAML